MSPLPAASSTSSPTAMSVALRTDTPQSTHEPPGHLDGTPLENSDVAASAESPSSPSPPLRMYTRPQLLSLSQSPMVKPPPDMPDLRTWFGVENENLITKRDEPSVPNARERRFRRDADDGDPPSRPTFRSALQPSQMGNFKHQSLRDRDREAEKERDKDGHERLRHLSDKFDRDRILPLSGTRNKDRDPVPHVNPSTTRGQPALPPNGVSRRADVRESSKKKVGEAHEDWRRGGEPPRSGREDRPENSRRDREDRDRESGRSRHRDSSRSKRETSSSRRDRDRDEDDDARHWRDDGKRDERMAARRERERERIRAQERESDDRRWPPGEERDGGRYKRGPGRERKTTSTEAKEKEDRQKEREPAWMDTYIPNESTSGILGGQAPNGELDGIQAWKKGLKEKDTRDKEISTISIGLSKTLPEPISSTSEISDKPLDEIQLFRLLMKKEEDKKRLEQNATALESELAVSPGNDNDRIRQRNTSTDDMAVNLPSVQNKTSLSSLSSSASVHTSPIPPFNLKDPAVLTSVKLNQDSLHGPTRASPIEHTNVAAAKSASELAGSAFPPVGSRVLAMKNKTAYVNPTSNIQNLNVGLQSTMPESLQGFSKNESLRPHGAFSPFDDPSRHSYILDDSRDLSHPANQGTGPQRIPVDQLFSGSTNSQTEANYNSSLSKGSRLAKIFENKPRDMPVITSKPSLQTSYTSPASNQAQRHEVGTLGGASTNPVHSVEELMAMLNNSSQRNNPGLQSNPHLNNNFNNGVPSLLPLQQQVPQQQQPPTNRLEPLYESRTEDRGFVPDGMVPGLRTAPPPPPRRESLGHFNDPLDESLPYNLQRLTQQPQVRGLDQLFNNPVPPLFNQQISRPGGMPLQPLQQNQFRGGSSPALNATGGAPQRLPPGLANLGGRPPHDPSQYVGLQQNLPSLGPQHGMHGGNSLSQQQQLPFNGYNVSNTLSNGPSRVPGQNNLQNSANQFNLGHHGLDPRLSNHHHLMGIGGSGITSNRITSGFPPQQALNGPNHVGVRPQQQQLLPHMLPHLMPPHIQQQGHSSSSDPQSHDLMAVLMGAPHRE